ncbi:MAG: CHAP domain-containing protein [Clostridiales bacterium]|nr:CHAP domain-containing protein [Clostridiales bacterium]
MICTKLSIDGIVSRMEQYNNYNNNYRNNNDEEIRRYLAERKRKAARKRRMQSAFISVGVILILAIAVGIFAGGKVYARMTKEPVNVISDTPMAQTAAAQLGNEGGEPFWRWFGFDDRVEWCACFASWCEDQCGYLSSGKAPKFAMVGDGASWFMDRESWIDEGDTPAGGDLIFFDWDQDHNIDHVGIVSAVVEDKVFTIEGNSSDLCRQKRYTIDSPVIYGYGHIAP